MRGRGREREGESETWIDKHKQLKPEQATFQGRYILNTRRSVNDTLSTRDDSGTMPDANATFQGRAAISVRAFSLGLDEEGWWWMVGE